MHLNCLQSIKKENVIRSYLHTIPDIHLIGKKITRLWNTRRIAIGPGIGFSGYLTDDVANPVRRGISFLDGITNIIQSNIDTKISDRSSVYVEGRTYGLESQVSLGTKFRF